MDKIGKNNNNKENLTHIPDLPYFTASADYFMVLFLFLFSFIVVVE